MYSRRRTLRILSFLVLVLLPGTAFALPPGFTDELVLDNLDQPIDIATLPSGEMLILLRGGSIIITDPIPGPAVAVSYLQLPQVDSTGEKGLLSIALDPNFATNNYFYVYYHHATQERARISRFIHYVDHANAVDEAIVWEDDLPYTNQAISDHWGGGFGFGPDGNLYLAIGDKKDDPNDAQNLILAAGKILRLNPAGLDTGGPWVLGAANSHLIPVDNPFIDGPGGALDEIWALGLRNPFRATWDFSSGRFFIGEVGDNIQSGVDASHEDIHVVTTSDGGVNFGWPICEGPTCATAPPSNYSPPLFSILHPDSRAIVAGLVYDGTLFPSTYQGTFFMADFARGWLRTMTFDGSGDVSAGTPAGGIPFDTGLGSPVAFEIGPEGAIYYADLDSQTSTSGQLRRITFNGGNQPPVIQQASATPTSGPTAPQSVDFVGLATDPESSPVNYVWDFGDASQGNGASVTHIYTSKGSFSARLQVDDGQASSLSDSIDIEIGVPPIPSIAEPLDGTLFRAGDAVPLRGSATDPDGTLSIGDLLWSVQFLHDGHSHPVLTDTVGNACAPTGSSCLILDIPTSGHDFSGNTGFEVSLRVTDSDGLTRSDAVVLDPDKVDMTFDTNVPSGVTLKLDQVPRSAPFQLDTLIGFQHEVEAPEEFVSIGSLYDFDQWSNGVIDLDQVITVPAVDESLTASYIDLGPPTRISAGLQALYTFSEATGTTIADTSGVAAPIDLTITSPGAVTWLPGRLRIDSSATISGSATRLNDAIKTSGTFTLEAWLIPASATQTGPARIVSLSDSGSTRNATLGQGEGAGGAGSLYDMRVRTEVAGLNGSNPSISTAVASLNTTLTHVVYTVDSNGSGSIYLDGVLAASGLVGSDLSSWDSSYPLLLANEATGTRPWLGTYDLLAFFERNLSQEEVVRNFEAGPDAASGNAAPIAEDDAFSASEATAAVGNVLADNGNGADSDPDMDPISVIGVNGQATNVGTSVVLASTALATVGANGSFTYDPNGAFEALDGDGMAMDQLTYTIEDTAGRTASATVSVSVQGVNDAPVMTAIGNQSLDEGASLDVPLASTDVEPHSRVFSLSAGAPSFVTLSDFFDGTGNLNIAPAPGDAGAHPLTVEVTDQGTPNLMDDTSFTITVTDPVPPNMPPVAQDDVFATGENTAFMDNLWNDNGNGADTDPDLDPFTVVAVNGSAANMGASVLPSGAMLTVTASGDITYDPGISFDALASGSSANEIFTYTIDDAVSGTSMATVSIEVAGVNDPPSFTPVPALSLVVDTVLVVPIQSDDPESDARSISLAAGAPAFAEILDLLDGTAQLTLSPTSADVGTYSISLDVTDSGIPNLVASTSVPLTVDPARVDVGLEVLYTFDAAFGPAVYDRAGLADPIHLTIADPANVTWGTGTLHIDNSTLIASLDPATRLNDAIAASGALTLEAWLTPDNATQTGPAGVVGLSAGLGTRNVSLAQGDAVAATGDFFDVRLRTTTTGVNGDLPSVATAAGSIAAVQTHVVYTRDAAGAVEIYIDGVSAMSTNVGGDLSNWDSSFQLLLANESTGDRPWLGSFDLVAVYGRALSASEVQQNFAAGPNPMNVPEPSSRLAIACGVGLLSLLTRSRRRRVLMAGPSTR